MGDHPAWGVALLRMMLGVIFVMHGWYAWAIIGPRDLTDLMVRVGNPPGVATLLAGYTIAAHLIGGALLIVGFLTPWAALGQVPITAGGLFLFRWPQGFFLHGTIVDPAPGRPVVSGYEYSLLLLVGTLALVMTGGGALSIDHARGHRIGRRMEVP